MKILIGGDYCPVKRIADKLAIKDFSFLDDYKNFSSAEKFDFSILNLECPIIEENDKPIIKQGLNLGCSKNVIDSLKYANVNLVTLANNHILDYDSEALIRTKNLCERNDILSVGVGENLEEASHIVYLQKNNVSIAIINCCEHEFSIATQDKPGANPLNPIQQYYQILEAKRNADYVLVIIHGGHEYWQLPSPRMTDIYRFLVDAGADAVINHHQHCYSGYEIYNTKPIFYGLGNFCFDDPQLTDDKWNYGYLVSLDFKGGNVEYEIFPYEQCNPETTVRLLKKDSFDDRLTSLNKVISNPIDLLKQTAEYYSSCEKSIKMVFEPFGGRIFNGMRRRGWLPSLISQKKKLYIENLLWCESHRDKLLNIFRTKR